MKKGIITRILIFAALIATIVLTMPENTFWTRDCSEYHNYKRVNCDEQVCTRCGRIRKSEGHLTKGYAIKYLDSCTYEESCKTCGKVIRTGINHTYETNYTTNCQMYKKCIYCEKVVETSTADPKYHIWSEGDCLSGISCIHCGEQAPRKHQIGGSPIYGVHQCARCNHWYTSFSKGDVILILVQVLGVSLTAFAFQYVVRRRKYMKVHWWIIIMAWLFDCSYGSDLRSDMRPAFLWKKEWKLRS